MRIGVWIDDYRRLWGNEGPDKGGYPADDGPGGEDGGQDYCGSLRVLAQNCDDAREHINSEVQQAQYKQVKESEADSG